MRAQSMGMKKMRIIGDTGISMLMNIVMKQLHQVQAQAKVKCMTMKRMVTTRHTVHTAQSTKVIMEDTKDIQ